ncbi:MAG: radical SAM protein [Patescibacteria group bacterium]|jgi:MoaA/NifB/PqqE/SkfB family radical SAM enzyme
MNNKIKKLLFETEYLTGGYHMPPEFLSLIITFRCNFRCPSCSIWQKQSFDDELTEVEWLSAAENIKKTLKPNAFVEINGGEPLIRKNLTIKIIQELKKYFKSVALNSNGLLINQETVKELENAGLDILKISFYSLDQETHNNLRGTSTAYDSALKAIKLMSASKIKLEVGVLVTSHNIEDLPRLVERLQETPNTTIVIQPLDESVELLEAKNNPKTTAINDGLWPAPEVVQKTFSWLSKNNHNIKNSVLSLQAIRNYYLDRASALRYRCFAGQRNLVIYPNGEITFCFKRGSVGNIKNKPLNTTLKGAKKERLAIKKCPKYCRIIGCNFSRGIKELFIKK